MTRPLIGFATSAKYRYLTPGDLLAVEQLRQRGYDVQAVVWSEVSPNNVACEAVVIRSVWDYHLDVERFLKWVSDLSQLTIVLNDAMTVHCNSDKGYLLDLHKADLPVPGMVRLKRGHTVDLGQVLRSRQFSRAVIKPTVSASAYETYLIDTNNAEQIEPRINQLLESRDMLVQEFVPEIETSGEWSLIFFGEEYSHAVRKIPQAGDFRVQAEHGGRHLREEPPAAVRNIAQRVIDQFAHTLYARVDIVEAVFQPLIMEVELIDPELFLTAQPSAAADFADVLLRMMKQHPAHGSSAL